MEDQRFVHIAKDPKFRRIPKGQTKIKIDKRFQSMFKDKKFLVKYTTDKRGRPVSHSSREDLKRYYHISSEESDLESNSDNETAVTANTDTDQDSENSSTNNEVGQFVRAPKIDSVLNELAVTVINTDKKLSDSVKKKLKNLNVDYARGESTLFSDSSSDDDETDEEISESEVDHKWGELDADAETTDKITHRLAACNMDWDRIRAVDLMVLLNSFLPPGGIIKSVIIYPSQFGKQRMQEEELKGPIELVSNSKNHKDPVMESATEENEDQNNEEGSKYHMEKLRQYQLNRLKYYYAVITFDSPSSANKIYTECDGMEYESSATKIDLRFIPDETSFNDDEVKEKCDRLPELDKYKPRFFTTTALQQAKVDLTWDETDPDRLELAEKINSGKLDEISEKDLQNYLAESSSEEEANDALAGKVVEENLNSDVSDSEERSVTDKYKLLLQEIQKNDKKKNQDVEMEITWGINLKEKTDQMIQNKISDSQEKTPFQKYLDKRKEKRKEKRLAQKKQNSESEEDMPSDININDRYFAEEFDSYEFKTAKKKKDKASKAKTEDIDSKGNTTKQKELELLLEDEDDGKKHFSLKKIQEQETKNVSNNKKKKRKNKSNSTTTENNEDEFKVNVEDERFSVLFTSHHYNIDPTDPRFKKTKGMETLISEKLKRRNRNSDDCNTQNDLKKVKLEEKSRNKKNNSKELSLLVKSVKRQADNFKFK